VPSVKDLRIRGLAPLGSAGNLEVGCDLAGVKVKKRRGVGFQEGGNEVMTFLGKGSPGWGKLLAAQIIKGKLGVKRESSA